MLQWGRAWSSAESSKSPARYLDGSTASMGPRLVERGKSRGAKGSAPQIGNASMGPRLVERGKAQDQAFAQSYRALQWGRAWSSAESLRLGLGVVDDDVLQWGRAWSSAERPGRNRSIAREPMLQWGRARSSAESRSSMLPPVHNSVLQWGRAWLSAERAQRRRGDVPIGRLQWGRAWLSAESHRAWLAGSGSSRASMGPRLVERGKSGRLLA